MKKRLLILSSFVSVLSFGQIVNMSNGTTNTCAADFYDSGGPGSNYGNNENLSHTFYPATPGSMIEISFASYQSGAADQISIYDGPDNTYPLLFNGGGTLSIPTFTATDFTGAITIEFTSNGAGNQAGWVASISCCASPQWWYADNDGDGYGSSWDVVYTCTMPVGYVANGDDCDDSAITFEDNDGDGFGNPLVQGPCGSPDNSDCDDNLITYEDFDGDGFGNPNVLDPCGVTDGTDCDDNDNAVGSGTFTVYYEDQDGDGFGIFWSTIMACNPPAGYVTNTDDCDDFSFNYEDLDGDGFGNPLVLVGCGSYDNTDCDDNLITYEDNDGDNFGDPNIIVACGVADNTDCDDNDAGVGSGIITTFYADFDGDGFGDPWNTAMACTPPAGYVANNDDCDDWSINYEDLDGDGFGNPLVQVACGSYDNSDCDDNLLTYADNDGDNFGDPNTPDPCGITDNTDCDDNDAGVGGGTITAYYGDWDGDGFGNPWDVIYSCTQPAGYVTDSSDCSDWAITYPDADGDGFGVPGTPVPCGAFNDLDCDDNLLTYDDQDGDTYGNPNMLVPCGITDNTDCDDFDPGVGGGAMLAYYNDWDGDTYGADGAAYYSCTPVFGMVSNTGDCNDWDPAINPGATELAGNGIDDDCDGYIDPVAAITEPAQIDFTVYPNPADDIVYIVSNSTETVEVSLLNVNGQLVSETYIASENEKVMISVESLEPGIYFIQIRNGEDLQVRKLIVR